MTEDEQYFLMGKLMIDAGILETAIRRLYPRLTRRGKVPSKVGTCISECQAAVEKMLPRGPVDKHRIARAGTFFKECRGAFEEHSYYVHGSYLMDGPLDGAKLRALGVAFVRLRAVLPEVAQDLLATGGMRYDGRDSIEVTAIRRRGRWDPKEVYQYGDAVRFFRPPPGKSYVCMGNGVTSEPGSEAGDWVLLDL